MVGKVHWNLWELYSGVQKSETSEFTLILDKDNKVLDLDYNTEHL